jgi:hypothetical protein
MTPTQVFGCNTMLTFQPNRINLFLRCFSIVFAVFMTFIFISHLNEVDLEKIIFWKVKLRYLFYLLTLVWVFYILTITISLFGIIRVSIDNEIESLTLTSLFSERRISISDIISYNSTLHKNQFKSFSGIRFAFQDKVIWLAGQNIKKLDELKDFLDKKGVKDNGIIKMKFPFN